MGKTVREKRTPKKKTTASAKFASNESSIIIWAFDKIDRNGEFAFDPRREDFDAVDIFQKILGFSNMKWYELFPPNTGKSRHHPLSPDSFSKQAVERIKLMELEDETDAIYSFAISGKIRLIGIRDGAIFHVVWYDPNHNFAQSKLKNT